MNINKKIMKKLKIPLLLLVSNLTFADYTAKIILQSDNSINNVGSLPAGSINFSNGNGDEDVYDPLEDPEHIVCTFAGGGIGVPYNGYIYHHIQSASDQGPSGTVWFQNKYIGETLGTTFTRGQFMGGNYYEICAPNKMYDEFNLKDETENGMTGLLVSFDGINFENTVTRNYDVSENGNYFNVYFASTNNNTDNINIINASRNWTSGGYANSCVQGLSYPTSILKGQLIKSNSMNLNLCGINRPGTLQLDYTTNTGDTSSIILNITP